MGIGRAGFCKIEKNPPCAGAWLKEFIEGWKGLRIQGAFIAPVNSEPTFYYEHEFDD